MDRRRLDNCRKTVAGRTHRAGTVATKQQRIGNAIPIPGIVRANAVRKGEREGWDA